MSNKLVRKKKNKPKYGWMQDEIDALARKDARGRQLAGYGVTMANHASRSMNGSSDSGCISQTCMERIAATWNRTR